MFSPRVCAKDDISGAVKVDSQAVPSKGSADFLCLP